MTRCISPFIGCANPLKPNILPVMLTGWVLTMGLGLLGPQARAMTLPDEIRPVATKNDPQWLAMESGRSGLDYSPLKNNALDGRWGPPHTGSQTTTGGRDYCLEVNLGGIALIPATHWGVSTTQTPTLWFYLPYAADQMAYGEFLLFDDQGIEPLVSIPFTGAETAGWVSITLPALTPPLVEGTDYNWAIQLYCRPGQSSPLTLEGWLQVNPPSPSVTAALNDGTVPAYQVYWNERLWFDLMHELMQQRLTDPTDTELTAQWLALLKDAGFENSLDNLAILESLPIIGPVPTE